MININNFFSFQFQIHGGGGHKASDGVAGGVAEFLTFIESLIGLSPAEIFSVVLPGISAMANIHPMVVHFPIALLLLFFIVDFLGSIFSANNLRQFASGLLYLGTVSAGLAVAAGLIAESSVEHGENVHLILQRHEFFGLAILSLSLVLSIWRLVSGGVISGFSNFIFLLIASVLSVFIFLGADLGGLMVYKHGVAVEAVKVTSMDYFHEHTHSH